MKPQSQRGRACECYRNDSEAALAASVWGFLGKVKQTWRSSLKSFLVIVIAKVNVASQATAGTGLVPDNSSFLGACVLILSVLAYRIIGSQIKMSLYLKGNSWKFCL